MIIETKYGVGDRVTAIRELKKEKWETCDCCDGNKIINIKGFGVGCPQCGGRGLITDFEEKKWTIDRRGEIDTVQVAVTYQDKKAITYFLGKKDYFTCQTRYESKDIFKDKKTALKECAKRNGESNG